MLVALIAVSLIAALLALSLVFLISRPSPTSQRERLLERDVHRLHSELGNAHDKLMHLLDKPWNLAPADVGEAGHPDRDIPLEQEIADEQRVLAHDDLDDSLLLDPPMLTMVRGVLMTREGAR